MKTPEQIQKWLQEQPYYQTLKDSLIASSSIATQLLNGECGENTMLFAVLVLDPSSYDWYKIEDDFRDWYNQKED